MSYKYSYKYSLRPKTFGLKVAYTATGAITDIDPVTVTFSNDVFKVPKNVTEFTFRDDGALGSASFDGVNWNFELALYTDTQIQTLIDAGYIPVASPADLHAVRTSYEGVSTRNFAVGTKWETGEINTTGLAGSYIQVADIDLYAATRTGGAYDNTGSGWAGIGTFAGIYDAAGHVINGMHVSRTTDYASLFTRVSGTVRNLAMLNVDITVTQRTGGIAGRLDVNGTISNCVSSGQIKATNTQIGGIIGPISDDCVLKNCFSTAKLHAENYIGGILAGLFPGSRIVSNCWSSGYIIPEDTSSINIGGIGATLSTPLSPIMYANCYFNTHANHHVGYNQGMPQTGQGLLNIEGEGELWHPMRYRINSVVNKDGVIYQANDTTAYTDVPGVSAKWDIIDSWRDEVHPVTGKKVWSFRSNMYPILNIFGLLPMNYPAPLFFRVTDETTHLHLSWNETGAKGYNIYEYDSGVWNKVNTSLITDDYYDITPVPPSYKYILKAVYDYRGFESESDNTNDTDAMTTQFDNGKIFISADDLYPSWYSILFPLCQEKGIAYTGHITGDLRFAGVNGWIEAKEMHDAGMDMQCHTYTHPNLTDLTEQEVLDELTDNDNAFIAAGIPAPKHIAYPYGQRNDDVISWVSTLRDSGILAQQGYQYMGVFGANQNKYLLARVGVDGRNMTYLDYYKQIIKFAHDNKLAVGLLIHKLVLTEDELGLNETLKELLEAIVDYAKEIGMDIITLSELYDLLD